MKARDLVGLALASAMTAVAVADGSAQSFGPVIDCVDCSYCSVEGETGNKAPDGDETSVYDPGAGSHEDCVPTGGCSVQHPINGGCPGFGDDDEEELLTVLDAAARAIAAGDLEQARRIARSGGRHVVYVPERDAIQALGCRNQVIAHIPLSPGLRLGAPSDRP